MMWCGYMSNKHGGKREGAGRPEGTIMPEEQKRKMRNFRATDKEYEIIKSNAEKDGINISEFIRRRTLDKDEFIKRVEATPEIKPDEWDLQMLKEIDADKE